MFEPLIRFEYYIEHCFQRRFLRPKFDLELRTNAFTDEDSEDTKWWIPLTYTSGKELNFGDTKPKMWLKPTEDETVLTDMPEEKQFVLMNVQAAGRNTF